MAVPSIPSRILSALLDTIVLKWGYAKNVVCTDLDPRLRSRKMRIAPEHCPCRGLASFSAFLGAEPQREVVRD